MKFDHLDTGNDRVKNLDWQARVRAFGAYILIFAVLMGLLTATRSITELPERTALSYNILASVRKPEEDRRVIIVMCTDNTIEQLAHIGGWPLDRSYYAAVLKTAFAKSKTVVFDILFTDETNTKSDAELAEAVNAHGGVVLARSSVAYPINALLDTNARVGSALEFAENDSDAISRRYKLYVNEDHCTGPSLICAAMLQEGYEIDFDYRNTYTITPPDGSRPYKLSVDDEGYFYRIPVIRPRDIQVIDFYDVFCGNYEPGLFDDAVVFVGGSVAGYEDVVHAPDYVRSGSEYKPYTSTRVIGTKFLADSYLTALSGFSPVRVPAIVEALVSALIFLASAFIAIRFSFKFNWLIELLLCGAWIWLSRSLFVSGLCYIGVIAPLAGIALAFLLILVLNLLMASHEWMVSSVPTEALYRMTYELENVDLFNSFEEYVSSFSDDIFHRLGANLISAQTTASHELFSMTQPPAADAGAKVVRTHSLTRRYGTRALVIIPLPILGDGEPTYTILGAVRRFSANWNQSVTALILAMYVYYKAEKQSAEKQQMALTMITMVIQMMDAKDPVTAGHSRRVSQYSGKLAEWLGFEAKAVADVEFSALLHDVGKIGVEDTVLNKPGIFTEADFVQMKSHTARGAEIVSQLGLPDDVVDGVLHHHERIDGAGYPDGIGGDQLTDFAKIIKVADVFDALTTKRQYKSAWGAKRALDMISRGLGTEFDEKIARVFIEHMAPQDYIPATEENGYSEANIAKSAAFALLLWESAAVPVTTKRNTMSRLKESFDFCCESKFAGIEWGERFGTSVILKNLPSILHYDEQTDSTIIALRGPREGIVNNVICYFRKGCLSAGIVTMRPGTLPEAEKQMDSIYGEKTVSGGIPVWLSREHIAVELSSDGNDMIAYITGYLSNEI